MFLNNRDHRKITVIDGKVGYTGGYNLANEYFNYTHPYGEWKDTESGWKEMRWLRLRQHFGNVGSIREDSGRCGCSGYRGTEKYLVQHPYQAKQTGYIQPYADCPLDGIQVERMSISVSSTKRTDTAGS